MADAVLEHWLEGRGLNESQINPLGVRVPDPDEGDWTYGRFVQNGTYNFGQVIRHAKVDDIQGSTDGTGGTITTAAVIGNDKLIDTGEFAAYPQNDVQGALGYIYDGTGQGQNFWVIRVLDANMLQIAVLTDRGARHDKNGWARATGTDSAYRLRLPGYFYRGEAYAAADAPEIAGVYQGDQLVVTDDYKPYGWVRSDGVAYVLADASGQAPTGGGHVIPVAGGLVVGVRDSGTTAAHAVTMAQGAARSIGRALHAEALDSDLLIPVALNLPNWGISRRNIAAGERHAHNRVNIGV